LPGPNPGKPKDLVDANIGELTKRPRPAVQQRRMQKRAHSCNIAGSGASVPDSD
jgi:hypothetical protein